MRQIELGKTGVQVPAIAIGCMRINRLSLREAEHYIQSAIEQGAVFFDHADIYGAGSCEEVFAKAYPMSDDKREKLMLQSKCGIRRCAEGVVYDFSKQHILASVEGILKRLKTDYLDVLLLHRPDALAEPEEVAEAFETLHSEGKVRYFGVSNQNPMQMMLLQKYLKQPLVANQLQFSIAHASIVAQGLHVNMLDEDALNRDGSVLDFCRLNDITIQPWSPFQYGLFEGVFLDNEKFPVLNQAIHELAEKYGVSNVTIALAWILRHPAHMQPVIGTMNSERMRACVQACEIGLTREEWYKLYHASGHTLP